MIRRTSILKGLQCFEAVARHMSMKLAARDLAVSESAISHQMRDFSEAIGQQLFVKSGRGIVLTPAGEELRARIPEALSGLNALVQDMFGATTEGLELGLCSSFGPGWLIPRMHRFIGANPGIDLRLKMYARDPLLTNEVADAFITADALRPGFHAVPLLRENIVAAIHPELKAQGVENGRVRLIVNEMDESRAALDWQIFCDALNLDLDKLRGNHAYIQCSHFSLSLAMACNKIGMALLPDFIAERPIAEGVLERFVPQSVPSGRIYHLCYREKRAGEPKIKALQDWLLKEVAA